MPVSTLRPHDPPEIEITYIGGPTALLKINGVVFITDPTFDAAGGTYQSGTVSLRKTQGPAVDIAAIGKVDVALVSHEQHPDNLDSSGRARLKDVATVLTTVPSAARIGHGAIGLAPWQKHDVTSPSGRRLRITATPARHGPPGVEKVAVEVTGFVISAADTGEDLVYITGDTVWYDGTREVAKRFRPRTVLLFGGAAMTRGPFHLTMDTNDALELAAAFPAALIVPVHHEGWAHFTQSQDDLAKAFDAMGFADRLLRVEGGRTLEVAVRHGES
jgi:L-ascorbate metabolism protein UlaG (beta-lactamase superfamily)